MEYNNIPICPIRQDALCMGNYCVFAQKLENACIWVCGLVSRGQDHAIQRDYLTSHPGRNNEDGSF